ncbi:MAG: hypothetical protein M4579_003079 [Chaenotheca gracillima]|nr:MAG: hypothetical protein M4579_003079 [Chaenotheca gracillima]
MSSRKGRGGSRNKSNRPAPTREVTVSKALSWLLRHGLQKEGIKMDSQGYANVADVVRSCPSFNADGVFKSRRPHANDGYFQLSWHKLRSQKVDFAELRALVAENDKQRFTLIRQPKDDNSLSMTDEDENDPSSYLIRASQGHTIEIDSSLLLTPITKDTDPFPAAAIHGTNRAAWKKILASRGLSKMRRNHIHFAPGLPGSKTTPKLTPKHQPHPQPASQPQIDTSILSVPSPAPESEPTPSAPISDPVISGFRASSEILIYVDIRRSLDAGLKWWRSDNQVLLTEGDGQGMLAMEFFDKAVESGDTGQVIWERKTPGEDEI